MGQFGGGSTNELASDCPSDEEISLWEWEKPMSWLCADTVEPCDQEVRGSVWLVICEAAGT